MTVAVVENALPTVSPADRDVRMPWPVDWNVRSDVTDYGACRRMWSAALLCCLRDVFVGTNAHEKRHVGIGNRVSRSWVGSVDFMMMCQLAGLNPEAVRDRMRNIENDPDLQFRLTNITAQGGIRVRKKESE